MFEVLEYDIARSDQLGEYRFPGVAVQVQRQASFVSIHVEVIGRLTTGKRGTPLPGVVTPTGSLYLDDIGTKISEQHRAQRSGQHSAQVDHLEPVEGGLCHCAHVFGIATVSSMSDRKGKEH